MAADVTIKAGDLLYVRRTLRDGNGDPVNLTDTDVLFSMALLRGPRTAVLEGAATIVDAEGGVVEYQSEATAGLAVDQYGVRGNVGYQAEFIVTYSGGEEQTFPGGADLLIEVQPRAVVEEAS